MTCDRDDFKLSFPDGNLVKNLLLGVPDENGSVHFWIDTTVEPIDRLLVYLTPTQAMAFSKALRRLAIVALEDGA